MLGLSSIFRLNFFLHVFCNSTKSIANSSVTKLEKLYHFWFQKCTFCRENPLLDISAPKLHVPTSIVEFHLTWISIDQRFILLPEKIPETTSGQKVSNGNTNKTYIFTNSGIGALIYKKSIHFTKRSLILLHFFGFRFHWFDWRFFCDYFDTKVYFPRP